ncbi:hypothetical protein ACFWN2_15440 [Lentzea sp. NPDC058436]
MELVPHNPAGDWVHAMEVLGAERFLFVSGTMASTRRATPVRTWPGSST